MAARRSRNDMQPAELVLRPAGTRSRWIHRLMAAFTAICAVAGLPATSQQRPSPVGRDPEPHTLQGKITWLGERTFERMWVLAIPKRRPGATMLRVPEGDSTFRLDLRPGEHDLVVRAFFEDGVLIGRHDDLWVGPGPGTTNNGHHGPVEIQVWEALDLEGQVLGVDGNPLPHVGLTTDSRSTFRLTEFTDEHGRFRFQGLEPGFLRIAIDDLNRGEGSAYVLLDSETAPLVLRQQKMESLEAIISVDGRRAKGARVRPVAEPDHEGAVANDAGYVRLEQAGAPSMTGSNHFRVLHEGVEFDVYALQFHDRPLDWRLRTGEMRFAIHDEYGKGVPNLDLELEGSPFDAKVRKKVSSDERGLVSVRVPAGTYTVEHHSSAGRIHQRSLEAGTDHPPLELLPLEQLRLRFIRPNGNPAQGRAGLYVQYWIDEAWNNFGQFVEVNLDTNGEATVPHIAIRGQPVLVKGRVRGGSMTPLQVDPGPGRTSLHLVQLIRPGLLGVQGTQQAYFQFHRADTKGGPNVYYTGTGSVGEAPFMSRPLLPGTWVIQHNGAERRTWEVEVRSGQLTVFDMSSGELTLMDVVEELLEDRSLQ